MKNNTIITDDLIIDTSEYDYNITQIMSNVSSSILIKKDEKAKKWKINIDGQKIDQYFDRILVLCKRIYFSEELMIPKDQILCINGNKIKLYTYTDKFGINQAPVSPCGFAYYDSILNKCIIINYNKKNKAFIQDIDGIEETEAKCYNYIKPFDFHNYFLTKNNNKYNLIDSNGEKKLTLDAEKNRKIQ